LRGSGQQTGRVQDERQLRRHVANRMYSEDRRHSGLRYLQPIQVRLQGALRLRFLVAEAPDLGAELLDARFLIVQLGHVALIEGALAIQLLHVLADAGLLLVRGLDLRLILGALTLEVRDPSPPPDALP